MKSPDINRGSFGLLHDLHFCAAIGATIQKKMLILKVVVFVCIRKSRQEHAGEVKREQTEKPQKCFGSSTVSMRLCRSAAHERVQTKIFPSAEGIYLGVEEGDARRVHGYKLPFFSCVHLLVHAWRKLVLYRPDHF